MRLSVRQLRQEVAGERATSLRVAREHDAQVATLRKGRDELERVLKAQQVRMQVERRAREERHMDTIKVSGSRPSSRWRSRPWESRVDRHIGF